MKTLRASMAALLLAVTLPAVASASDITAAHVLRLMNAYRAVQGLDPLREDPRLDKAADGRMQDMEEQQYWSHYPPDGSSPFLLIRSKGYDYVSAGENLAKGFETAELLVSSWMESEGHRANILGTQYADVGIAIIDGETTKRALGKSIVVLFGRERAEAKKVAAK